MSLTLKTPKGTRDFSPQEMALRESIFTTITTVFKNHNAVNIDTPVFELKDILTGKYGEDSKLIYDLQDQGGEMCSLRYDLTVPFARFVAMNGKSYQNIKRYQIAKVYRRDNISIKQGRMREFHQCDFDIAGDYEPMIPDSEAIAIMCEILTKLDVGEFQIKMNNRKILDGMFEVCGVPTEKFRMISSAVDKLDKMAWADVRKEMVEEKGLDGAVADKIEQYVKLKGFIFHINVSKLLGSLDLVEKLENDAEFSSNENIKAGLQDTRLLLTYLDALGVLSNISFDLSLARGLDYYTGVIYEAVITKSTVKTDGIGSVASGGRYDNLVGMFSGSIFLNWIDLLEKNVQIPCVGISIGVERIFAILTQKTKDAQIRATSTQVYICGISDGTLLERMKIAKELWNDGISCAYQYKADKLKLAQQFKVCERDGIPLALVIGSGEIERGVVGLKDQTSTESKQIEVKREDMVSEIKKMLKI